MSFSIHMQQQRAILIFQFLFSYLQKHHERSIVSTFFLTTLNIFKDLHPKAKSFFLAKKKKNSKSFAIDMCSNAF